MSSGTSLGTEISESHFDPSVHKVSLVERLSLFQDILSSGSFLRVRVTGRSMTPFLGGGDILTIRKVSASSLKKGDLVFFKNLDEYPVIHRVVKKQKHRDGITFQTRGDALIGFDERVREEEILGKVCVVEKGEKHYNLEAPHWRCANYLRAMINLCESRLYVTLSTFKKLLT